MEEKVVRSRCRMCHNECGVLVRVQDGVVKKIEGDLGDPVTGGMMCSRIGHQAIHLSPGPPPSSFSEEGT